MIVYVIHEIDLEDKEHLVSGVASSLEDANRLLNEYYGKFEVISHEDVRDSNIEWVKKIKVHYSSFGASYEYKVWLERFELDKV